MVVSTKGFSQMLNCKIALLLNKPDLFTLDDKYAPIQFNDAGFIERLEYAGSTHYLISPKNYLLGEFPIEKILIEASDNLNITSAKLHLNLPNGKAVDTLIKEINDVSGKYLSVMDVGYKIEDKRDSIYSSYLWKCDTCYTSLSFKSADRTKCVVWLRLLTYGK